ncbi:hypothetical protein LCGC14_2748080, partial [marine sediment metagenome]
MSKHTPGPWEDMTKLKRLEQAVDQLTDSATHLFDVVAEIVQANAAINAELLDALIYADCGVNIAPTSAQLADITLASEQSARELLSE